MKTSILIAAFMIFCLESSGITIHVPKDYPKIQEAIDAAKDGDTVLVGPGTYPEHIDFLGKKIIVASADGPGATVIDAHQEGRGVTFKNNEGPDSVLEGFTVSNGKKHVGGGIYCKNGSPTIRGNVITQNWAKWNGGGIHCEEYTAPVIEDNEILDNKTPDYGGGIYCGRYSSPMISNNAICGNSGMDGGGGIFCDDDSQATITGNIITDNRTDWPYYGSGGGIAGEYHAGLTIDNNVISHNNASYGGGIDLFSHPEVPATISNNRIEENYAYHNGGGINLYSGKQDVRNNIIAGNTADYGGALRFLKSTMTFESNVVSGNMAQHGGGIIDEYGNATIRNNIITENFGYYECGGILIFNVPIIFESNTVAGNTTYGEGGGLSFAGEDLEIRNSVFWNNTAAIGPEIFYGSVSPFTLTISHCDVKGGQASVYVEPGSTLLWGPGNIDADPLFADAAQGDYHILYTSPCRDAGDNAAPGLPDTDFEGDPRIAFSAVDVGADEFHTHLYCAGSVSPGGSFDLKVVGLPGTAPVRLFWGSGVLDPPLNTKYGEWHLLPPLLAQVDLGVISSQGGILAFSLVMPGNVPPHSCLPLQSGVGMELSNLCILKVE